LLAAAILCLAAFNLTFCLSREVVAEWDEALYAISAHEMNQTGNIVATTFLGALDYYNSKPPLNVWLIALSFKALGVNLFSLRLASILAAWATVAVLQEWTRRAFGRAVALFSSLALSTTFGFLYNHSGRTAETDALFTLLVLLTVVVLWAEEAQPWHRAWLGLIAAAAFLLRGMAVLLPMAIVGAVAIGRNRKPQRQWFPAVVAVLLFVVPVGTWAVARWRLDGWMFFDRLFNYDFVARSLTVIEDHPGGPLYYLNILAKHHYDWLLAAIFAAAAVPVSWERLRDSLRPVWQGDDGLGVIIGSWAAMTLLVPTLMATKLPWYLNAFYPVFALGIGWILVRALAVPGLSPARRRLLVGTIVVAFAVAEGKLLWYPQQYRSLSESTQGLLLQEKDHLKNRRVFQNHWDNAEIFVASGILGAEWRQAKNPAEFWRVSRPGDCWVSSPDVTEDRLVLIRASKKRALYCRAE
jgi:4-amino-4-deoxy-L-arabinose transferase-like glycosyltransferase